MKYKKYMIIFAITVLFSISAISAENITGDNVWVSVDGCGTGESMDDPTDMKTAMDNLKDYSTVNFLDGTYSTTSEYRVVKRMVTLQAVNPGNVIFDGNGKTDIFAIGGHKITLDGFVFINCNVNAYGGAVDWFGQHGTMKNCVFQRNTADSGGAVFWESDNGTMINCTFKDNVGGGAGAIHWSGKDGRIINSSFIENTAPWSDGGAIHWSAANGLIENCTFINNEAPRYIGGAIYWSGENGSFANNFFRNNEDMNGYQLYTSNTIYLKNNTFLGPLAIYNEGMILSSLNVVINDNATQYGRINETASITATVRDDNGNSVGGSRLDFLIGESTVSANADDRGIYETSWKIVSEDTQISASYPYGENVSVFNSEILTSAIRGEDIVMYYRNGTKYSVHVNKNEGVVYFTVKNVTYTKKVENGVASLPIGLLPGEYCIEAAYENFKINNTIKVLPTLESGDLVKYYKNDSHFVVRVLDGSGNPVAGSTVAVTLNGASFRNLKYNIKTDEDGLAMLRIGLLPGNYSVSAVGPDMCMAFNRIVVLPTLEAGDLVKYYKNDSHFVVRVLDGSGNPVAGSTVAVTLNGASFRNLKYNIKTDGDGLAMLRIGLLPGNYSVSAVGPDMCLVSNRIVVLPTLEAGDLVKYYKNDSHFVIRVLDGSGNPVAGKTVAVTLNGASFRNLKYNIKTDENGIATLKINLIPGKYQISALYDGCLISNSIEVLSPIQSADIQMTKDKRIPFAVKIMTAGPDRFVTFKILDKVYTKALDENNVASLPIGLNSGIYDIITSYGGLSVTNKIQVM